MDRIAIEELISQASRAIVLVTTGYSSLGYEFPELVATRLSSYLQLVSRHPAALTKEILVVAGATKDGGICDITYEVARAVSAELVARPGGRARIRTVGLVSATAEENGVPFHDLDLVCVVAPRERGSWDVVSPEGRYLSVEVAAASGAGALFVFRGGEVAAKEVAAALRAQALCVVHQGESYDPSKSSVNGEAAKLASEGNTSADVGAMIAAKVFAVTTPQGIYRAGKLLSANPLADALITSAWKLA